MSEAPNITEAFQGTLDDCLNNTRNVQPKRTLQWKTRWAQYHRAACLQFPQLCSFFTLSDGTWNSRCQISPVRQYPRKPAETRLKRARIVVCGYRKHSEKCLHSVSSLLVGVRKSPTTFVTTVNLWLRSSNALIPDKCKYLGLEHKYRVFSIRSIGNWDF